MKYVIVLSDGMAGRPLPELGGRTTLKAARTPVMDALAPVSEIGTAPMAPVIPRIWQCWDMIRRFIIQEGLLWRR